MSLDRCQAPDCFYTAAVKVRVRYGDIRKFCREHAPDEPPVAVAIRPAWRKPRLFA